MVHVNTTLKRLKLNKSGGIVMKESMHEKIIGAGVANLFIERMKLEGWLPIKEYFQMEKTWN